MKRNLITSLMICGLIFVISPKILAQPVITGANMNVYNHIQGSGEGAMGEIGYRFEIFIDAIGNLSEIEPEDIRLSANEEVLNIDEIWQVEAKGNNLFFIRANGPFEEMPILGNYVVTIEDADGQTSAPFVIGVLEDYPKDAPEMLYPKHGQVIAEIQPTFRWEEFKSVYLDEPVDPWAYEIDLTFPNGDIFTVWPIPGDQTTLDYDNPDWVPSQPPGMLPGIYSLTVHSAHNVVSGFGFEHHRTIQFEVIGALIVEIDIKPGSFPNSVNPKSKGVIPVAILSTEGFDATTVDPLSVAFGPKGAMEVHGQGHIEDADNDGDLDLILHFNTQDTGIQCGDDVATLTGKTFEGQDIMGSDSIVTAGCN